MIPKLGAGVYVLWNRSTFELEIRYSQNLAKLGLGGQLI